MYIGWCLLGVSKNMFLLHLQNRYIELLPWQRFKYKKHLALCVRCLEGKEIEIHPCWTLTVRSYMAPLLLLFYWMSVTVSLDEAGRNCGLITHLIRLMRAYHLGILYFKLTVTGFRLMADRHAF